MSKQLCGAKNPVLSTTCVATIRHIHHRDESGRQWPAQDPDFIIGQAQLMDDLAELLSYCKTEAEKFDPDKQIDEFNPYDDVAYKLAAILDGEQ